MPRIVDIEGVGLVEVDDRIGENQLLEFSQTLRQGALPAAGSALMREGGRMVGGAMMGLTRAGLEEPPPVMTAAQAESPAGMAAYERRLADWQKRTKEVPPEVIQARAAELEASPTFQMGQALQRGAEEAFPINPLRQDDYLTQLASGVGSLPVSAIPGIGPLTYGLSAGEDQAQRAGQVYDVRIADALAKGDAAEADRLRAEKPVKQAQAVIYTAPIGALTERAVGAVPALGRAFTGQAGKRVIRETLRTGLEEAAQETSEQLLSNLVAREVYNPEQQIGEGLYESGTVGGGVGALVGGTIGGFGKLARGRRMAQIQEQRLVEGPAPGGQRLQEIIDRQAAGVAAIGGDPDIPLPNSTATLAGINSGGAPSGPIRITPPGATVVPPEEEITLPEMALEEEAAPVETPTTTENAVQEQVADEGLLRGEEPQPEVQVGLPEVDQGGRLAEGAGTEAQAEVQPLTVEETQEYNDTLDAAQGGSVYDILNDEQLIRFEELAGRVRQLEQAGFEFDEATGWAKPGVAVAAAEMPVAAEETPVVPAAPAPTPAARETSRTFPFQNRTVDGMIDRDTGDIVTFAKSISGTPEERGSSPKYTIKVDQDVTINAQSEKALDNALQKIAPGVPVRVFRNAGKGVTLDFSEPGPVTPTPTPAPTPAAAPKPARTVVLTPGAVTVTQTPAATPSPRPAPAIASQTVGSGKHANVLVKDLFAQQPDYAMWLVRSTRSAAPGSRIRQVGDYINSLPEYQNAVTEEKAKAEAILTDENQSFLTGLKITAQQNPDGSITLRGKTYDRQDDLRAAGGRYSKDSRTYTISAAGLGQFIERSRTDSGTTSGQGGGGPTYSRDVELRKLRENADNRPDRSGLEGGVDNYLGVETQGLIRQGEAFGIPREVGDEQIEDAAMMVRAFSERDTRPFFMLSSAPGTGKTFVLGAGIREMRKRGANKIIYVTLNRGLIKQIQQDLKAYNIGDVKFITYSEMKDLAPEESDVLIFDEAHAIKNLTGAGSEQAKKAQEWIQQTKFPIFSTATPFENPTQTAYLLNTGIFDSFNGDYKQFAAAYGATPIKKDGQVVRTVWLPTKTNEQDQIAARNFFRKEGIFTARKTRLPAEQVDSRLVAIKGDQKWTDIYNAFSDEAENQKGSLDGTDKMWVINYKKRLLEASKVKNAINEAWRALNAGRWPIIFVETKAERTIDINEQRRLQQEFKRAKTLAKMMGGESPKRSDYPGLLSDGLINLLESTMDKVGISAIEIPSAEEVIKREIGAQNVAIFTGSIPDAQAQKNLEEWRGKQPMVLVATMAKGGTGLSLHDKTGTHPTTQINVNLPWTATQVEQVSLRSARYGLKSKAQMMWLFADNIPFERELAQRVGGRMRDMGALVQGEAGAAAANIKNFNFEDESFSEANAAEAAKKDLTKEEPKVTPPAAPVVAAPKAPRKVSQVRQDAQEFDRLATDIAPDLGLIEDPALLSPVFSGNIQDKGSIAAKMARQKALATVKKRAIQQLGGNPQQNSEADRAALLPQMRELAAKVQQDRKIQAFDAAIQEGGPVAVNTSNLAVGDKITVGGSELTITAVDPDTMDATADGGEIYGQINLPDGISINIDAYTPAAAPAEEPAAPAERKPRLAAGETQGDLISSTQAEPFALVGEEGVDLEARKQKAQAAARAAAEAKAAQEKAQTQMDLSDAAAEASDAIAQFVESITPKAGITEGPTPEESARRVLEALTRLASVAIRAGIQSASQWATSLRLKLSPALQYAWDRAQGSTAEPTPEVIADVSNLPERAATDFGMIYSTPSEPVTTKRGGFEDVVAGRRALTPEVRNAGIQLAVETFNEAGVKFRQVADNLFAPVDGVDQEAAGRELVRVAKDKIAKAKADGRSDTVAELINSLRNHFGISEAFSPETRDELYLIGQSEASEFGRNLASLKASVKDFVALARNVRGFLTSAIYDNFNGESVKGVLDKIMTEFRGQFTEAEIQKIVGEKPDLQEMLNRFGVLALADTGGRVYRAVQARLKTKKAPTQKAKEQRALEDEAIEQIIENALALGVTEPAKPANRKLTPDERLALMTRPATQAKVQKATEDAVKEAEFNAGWKAMMADAAGNEELLGQYRDAMAAGEDPDPEAIEKGLDLPQYAHWRTIRDGFLNYSPTTLKLAQDVIRGRFKGTQFGPKKVAPPAPAKIDLVRLVQQPNAEMSRVIGEQLAAIEGVMDLAGASPEAKARVMQMITANVGSQVQLARQRVLNNFLDVKAKVAPIGASERLQRLINAGIIEDPRYKGDKTVELLKRVARKYITTQEFKEIATTDQAQKLPALTAKFNAIVSSENLTDEWMQGAVWAYLTERLQQAEKEITGRFFDLTPKPEPTTAGERLRKLINAGIANDPRYRSQKTRDLLKRVAKTYLTADELSGMATRTRAEKLAFLTGKLNQITAAENLADEWMQGAVWTYLTERMMEAENAVVSQIVGAKDVSFDPAQPKTDAQREADRAKAVERLAGGIRAGLLDQRIAESVAKNPALQRLVPKMSDLVKRVLNTPQAGQAKLAQAFSEALLSELAIDQALADKTGVALAKAFQAKFERARIRALDLAVQKLTPKQREEVGPGRPLWQKIEEFVNAGGMNSAALLQSIAKKSGWKVPTDEEVSRLRDLARLEQELSTATEEEIGKGITDDIKAAMNLGRRADIMREIQMRWARMTMPIRGNKQNLARAINEVTSAQLLFKPSFVTKQLIDVATQMFYYTPTRAVATAVERYRTSRDPNRASRLWKDTSAALEDAYKARFNALNMALTSALEAAKGRAEKDTIMGIQSGIRALDRINAQASEYAKNGDYARSALVRMIGISQLSFRFASSLDAFQGVLAEQQEIGAWAESQLRLQGMAPEQARKTAKTIIGDAMAEYALAQAIVGDDPNISPKERRAAAWNVVRARQYQRIKAAGLDAGALKELTQELRSTIGWNIEEKFGPGGRIVGRGIKNASDWLASVGIPNPVGRFSNAIAIGINRALTFAGGGFVPKAFEGSAWYKTETDKTQRKIEAATGLGLSGAFAALVLSGALRVFTRWPDDKEEADLWEREGHRPNTMELDLPSGKILRVSLNTGPIQIVRPALAAIGELQYQVARRNRLNQKAEAAAKKKGLKFEPRELTAKDIAGALAYGAYSAVAQGRTASGMIGSGVYRQAPDMGKIAAGAVSPLIPFGPLLREVTAMSGAEFNPKDQTFINLLVPTPWSGKVDRNFLGDPVGTPRAQERIMSVLTGGTAIVGGEDPDRAYQVLAKTGWTPATPQNNKFFQFGRVQRQATPEELTRMQEVRAVELKTRISQLDPATATKRQLDRIEDIANAKAKKAVGIR